MLKPVAGELASPGTMEQRVKNLNLSGRLIGMLCILLVLFTATASGQAFSFKTYPPASGFNPVQTGTLPESDYPAWIVLLDGMPLSTFRSQIGGKFELGEPQKDQLREYGRDLEEEQSHFIEIALRQGFSLTVKRTFTFLLNGLVVSLPAGDVGRLAQLPGVRADYPDLQVHVELADSVPLIGADQVWQQQDSKNHAVTGLGIRVALIDTGIDYTHPDLGGCFGPGCKVLGGYDLYNDDADPLDDNGHGTHCAGIVAADGNLKGVAPGASLYAYKVLNAYGYGNISLNIAAIERAADLDQDPATLDAVDIISISQGIAGTPDDPWPLAVDAAVEQGIMVAVSAGNSGPTYASVESPGLAMRAITVGASDKSDLIANFSSRGPVPGFDSWLKPDILAPGVDIISTYLDGTYASASGTSMAAPHVAGAAALIKQMHPAWTPEEIRSSLMNTAHDLGLNVHTQGVGRLQVDRAVPTSGLVTPASVSFGTLDISQPLWSDTRMLWLENVSDSVRIYSLSGDTSLPDGVTISVEPASMSLLPGEKRSFTVALAVDTFQTPPDLERDEGVIRISQGDELLLVPFSFLMPPIFDESRILPFDLQTSYAVALHDLDGDGDLDAFVGNTSYYDNPANTVWFNDGAGNFTDSGQRLGSAFTWDVALGDLDGDGDPDVFAANSEVGNAQADEIWLNNGQGYFVDSGQRLGNTLSRSVSLGDLDGDGDLDAFIANGISERGQAEANTVWLNDGHGVFSDSGQSLGNSAALDVDLGDLDGDGDLDAFIANGDPQRVRNEPNQVWLNDGQGFFNSNGQNLGNALSQAVVLGDMDRDGDLDAFIANGGPEILDGQPDEVWLNNGNGIFSNSGQYLGSLSSYGAALADLHRDGTLDVFVAGYRGGNRVWLNDGSGKFTFSGLGFGTENAADVALGDVDSDGDVDALVANAISKPNQLWLNRGSGGSAVEELVSPSGLTATALSGDSVHLAWMDNAQDETAYHVERLLNSLNGWIEISILPGNTTAYTDTGLSCSTQYQYRVRAHREDDDQYSAYSNTVETVTNSCSYLVYLPGLFKRPP
jgi:hypothetical protein